jgi:AcrR family transcriptional regulator
MLDEGASAPDIQGLGPEADAEERLVKVVRVLQEKFVDVLAGRVCGIALGDLLVAILLRINVGRGAGQKDAVAGSDEVGSFAGRCVQWNLDRFASGAGNSLGVLRPGCSVVLGIIAGRDGDRDARFHSSLSTIIERKRQPGMGRIPAGIRFLAGQWFQGNLIREMARVRSLEKRDAILRAAIHEIAESGLGAPTAKIAKRAGVAEGTLFTYFANKEELLNELYLKLKGEVYERINADFPFHGDVRERAWHVWASYLDWAMEYPERRKVSTLLHLSDSVGKETRARTKEASEAINATLHELEDGEALKGLPRGFAASMMAAGQEATMEFIVKQPEQRKELVERGFELLWRGLHG